MQTVRITKEFHFEGAHALTGYDGKCRHIHGHSYKLFVTVKGVPKHNPDDPKCGMLIDFTDLKKAVNQAVIHKYDHSLIIREGSPLSNELEAAYENIIILPFQPTCENLISHFAEEIAKTLLPEIPLYSLKLYETDTSYAEWFASDN